MKKRIKILSLMLMAVLAVSSVFGCSKKDSGDTSNSDPNSSTSAPNQPGGEKPVVTPDGEYIDHMGKEPDVVGTIHERSIGATQYKLFENGVTEYKIVLPSEPTAFDSKAAMKINTITMEATGVQFLSYRDDSIAYSDDAKYISIGNTGMLEGSGLTIDYDAIGVQGYEIITQGQSIFIAGGEEGVFFGALDLLEVLFKCEYFTAKYYYLEKNVKDLVLPDLDIKEKPDILNRISPYGETFFDTARENMRLIHDSSVFVNGAKTHSSFDILPPATWKDSYPGWYSADGKQLCMTAHSDAEEIENMLDGDGTVPEELDLMINAAIDKMQQLLIADTEKHVLSFSQQDYNVWCRCESCEYLINRYGTPAATQMIFINEVSDRMQPWLEENFPGRPVLFDILAYHQSERAPAKQVDGEWVALDEHMVLRDNINVFIALIGADYVSNINAPSNITMKNTFLSWAACSSNFAVWTYDCYFGDYLVPYDSWGAMSDTLKFLYKINAHTLFLQGSYNLANNTNFDSLKNYVYSKLMWNVNLDMQELINHYFDCMYKDMSDTMKTVYWNMRAQLHSNTLMGRDGSIWTDSLQLEYYSKQYFLDQLALLDQAKEEAKKYQTIDPAYYAWVIDEITSESIGPRYGLIQLYQGTFSAYELSAFIKEFGDDVLRLNVNRTSEGTAMTTYLKSIGY